MIMTKSKPQEIAALSDTRTTIAGVTMPEGTYTVTTTRNATLVRAASEQGSADFFVLGMVVPARKASAVSQLLNEATGLTPSPVMIMKAHTNAGVDRIPTSEVIPFNATTAIPTEDNHAGDEIIRIKEIEINPGRHEVKVKGKKITLTFSEFRILQALASKPGWVFSREKIIYAVHGDNYNCTQRAVDVQVTGLRKKMGSAGNYIQTVRGVGYRFVD